MRTLGVDLSAQPQNTAACTIAWSLQNARISSLKVDLTDDELVSFGESADKIGLDVPFGWPTKFVTTISAHYQGVVCEKCSTQDLRFRATDQYVKSVTGKWPLSVSTDLIGVVALRAIRLLERLAQETKVDRSGAGKMVEVYPAAALIEWGFANASKKQSRELAGTFLSRVSHWLQFSVEDEALLIQNRDAFDALIACLVSRAAAVGLVLPIPKDKIKDATCEGWIALPAKDSLSQLVSSRF